MHLLNRRRPPPAPPSLPLAAAFASPGLPRRSPAPFSSSSHSVAGMSCEVLGAAALQSMEASEVLASDGEIANGLARALGSGSHRVVEAACNAVTDLPASTVGREHLSGSPVLPRLLWILFLGLLIEGAPTAQQEF